MTEWRMSRTTGEVLDSRKQRPQSQVIPRVKVWLERDGEYIFGWGICEMLQAVDETGSIKDAATRVGKSYRYVWGRIKRIEQRLGESLVETRVGGEGENRSHLTPQAKSWVDEFVALRRRMVEVVEV